MLPFKGALAALLARPEPKLVVEAVRRLAASPAAQSARATITRHLKTALQVGAVEAARDLIASARKSGGES